MSQMEAAVKKESELEAELRKELEEGRERDAKTRKELQAQVDELEEKHKELTVREGQWVWAWEHCRVSLCV